MKREDQDQRKRPNATWEGRGARKESGKNSELSNISRRGEKQQKGQALMGHLQRSLKADQNLMKEHLLD